ncbi:MAG: DUF1465 family protein [Sphingobium sp.]
MHSTASFDRGLHRRLVDGLYVEAMVMADEARSYFDNGDPAEMQVADPLWRVAYTCESLKVTTRLMHIIAWLLSQRAWQRGEIEQADLIGEKYRLGAANDSDPDLVVTFPFGARSLIEASEDLYDRVARLQERMEQMIHSAPAATASPARALMDRLHTHF